MSLPRLLAALRPLFAGLLLSLPLAASAADVAGSADPPGFKRITGSEIFFQSKADFAALTFALQKIEWSGAESKVKPFRRVDAEGRRITTYYRIPAGMGVMEVLRNYEQELRAQGFEIAFSGIGEAVETVGYNNQIAREVLGMTGTYGNPEERAQWPFQNAAEAKAGYLAARKPGASGNTWASAYIVENTVDRWMNLPAGLTLVRFDVLEEKPREQRMSLVRSEEMARRITADGRIALYGILFDTDSATIRPESEATLAEVAKLLQATPSLKLLVVGHTDTQGSFSYNRSLSQRRAESVVANLRAKGIAANRLFPVGVSFAAPVASNASEDGRAKNRRVELVDVAGGRTD
ncbi:MAG: OmpA family protein [Silanimonas lenta]